MAQKRKFFHLSDGGDATERGRPRTMCSVEVSVRFYWSLSQGRRRRPPARRPLVKFDDMNNGLEDMPWSGFGVLVSERFKDLFERFDPDCAQFFPVTARYRGKLIKGTEYFIVNWLRRFPCIDFAKSDYETDMVDGVRDYTFINVVIDARKVPSDARVFLPDEYPCPIADDVFRKAVQKERITGAQFYMR